MSQGSRKRHGETSCETPQPEQKRGCFEKVNLTMPAPGAHMAEGLEAAFNDAVKKHPFHDNADHIIDFHGASVFRDANGAVCGVLLPEALPAFAAAMAADVLRSAATKTTLRSSMFGGVAPLSGIAGYFDYRGSPVELKCRKTSFTHEHVNSWPNVFPMIDYVSAIYKAVFPKHWAAQDAAVPDIVRIHGSPFSTLTINQKFRTASHTDAGDFDMGYGLLAVLEGNFRGLSLALDSFGVCFHMQPRDLLLFNTHFFHSNTEPELNHPDEDWDRLTCVFYYRTALGEPACVAEYKRRLELAKVMHSIPAPVVDEVVQKDNGDNFNKPALTFPLPLTPFGGAAGAFSLRGCAAAKLLRLHLLLLERSEIEVLLFGEPLRTDDGLPGRALIELVPVHSPVVVKAPAPGGFSETDNILRSAEEKQHFLDEKNLEGVLGTELVHMWSRSRALWLKLVKDDWERLLRNNPERTKFSWNNTSQMNSAFFDLCEVALQIMLGVLNKEAPSKTEKQFFWTIFAAHLTNACVTVNDMPRDAMGMRKLNVKLKDFHFGGTRYLKDMPPEEQKRRIERRQQIVEARRRGVWNRGTHTSGWLQNDAFDYQHEDREVDFKKNDWMSPEENVRRLQVATCGDATTPADPSEPINVLVVLPRPAAASHPEAAAAALPMMTQEASRILMNPAAQRLCASPCRNTAAAAAARGSSSLSFDGVKVTFVYDGDEVGEEGVDFAILQHALAALQSDEEAAERVAFWCALVRHCVFVVETDVTDRRHYILQPNIRTEYERVAATCFGRLYSAAYSTDTVRLRTTPSLIDLIKSRSALETRYKFSGSPLNTVVFTVVGCN